MEGLKKCREAILLTLGKQSDEGRCREENVKRLDMFRIRLGFKD